MAASFKALCVAEVLRLGKASNLQIVAAVGHLLPAAQALALGKAYLRYHANGERRLVNPDSPIYTTNRMREIGLRVKVKKAMQEAHRCGLVRRLAPGVYTAPLPKLFTVDEKSVG